MIDHVCAVCLSWMTVIGVIVLFVLRVLIGRFLNDQKNL